MFYFWNEDYPNYTFCAKVFSKTLPVSRKVLPKLNMLFCIPNTDNLHKLSLVR